VFSRDAITPRGDNAESSVLAAVLGADERKSDASRLEKRFARFRDSENYLFAETSDKREARLTLPDRRAHCPICRIC
jgi:hypothetical protein